MARRKARFNHNTGRFEELPPSKTRRNGWKTIFTTVPLVEAEKAAQKAEMQRLVAEAAERAKNRRARRAGGRLEVVQ